MFIDFRERGRSGRRERGTERGKHWCEKHWSVASCMCPDWGLNLQPRYVPWAGIEPVTFWCMGQHSNQLRHLARAYNLILDSGLCIHGTMLPLLLPLEDINNQSWHYFGETRQSLGDLLCEACQLSLLSLVLIGCLWFRCAYTPWQPLE